MPSFCLIRLTRDKFLPSSVSSLVVVDSLKLLEYELCMLLFTNIGELGVTELTSSLTRGALVADKFIFVIINSVFVSSFLKLLISVSVSMLVLKPLSGL